MHHQYEQDHTTIADVADAACAGKSISPGIAEAIADAEAGRNFDVDAAVVVALGSTSGTASYPDAAAAAKRD